jgi:nicotinic acid mononucleotide adenylyltransferase
LFFLIGADNFTKFYKWKNWKKIPKLAKIAIFPRQDYSLKSLSSNFLKGLNKNDLIYMNSKKINISSSLIRKFW